MTDVLRRASLPETRPSRGTERADELRRMALLLETADVLEVRARRATDPVQVAVLLRRADHRRGEAARLREALAAQGAALAAPVAEPPRAVPHQSVAAGPRRPA